MVDATGAEVGRVDAVELVTVGQRRGMELAGAAEPRYAVAVDMPTATVTVGNADDLLVDTTPVGGFSWADGPATGPVLAQVSAHGAAVEAELVGGSVRWAAPHRRVAPGQSVAFYEADQVLGGATAN